MARWLACLSLVLINAVGIVSAGAAKKEKTAAERGREAVWQPLQAPVATMTAYENLWKQWGMKEKPADYAQALRDRYGLHPATYNNNGLPMGFHQARSILGKGVGNDCLLCHGGSIAGQSIIGLGNASVDLQSLYDDLAAAQSVKLPMTFRLSNVRGTIEAAAGVIYLMQFRDANLRLQTPDKYAFRDDLCEDIPAWWHLKKKKTMYHLGSTDSRSVRTLMPFLLSPLNSGEYIKKQEPLFADIRAYLLTLQPPKYPYPVNGRLAAEGKELFKENCARCHGTYGPAGKYPNKIVALDEIGTDRALADGFDTKFGEQYLKSWFTQEKGPNGEPYQGLNYRQGYQAPPLDGIWATAPYFHNASVPTVYHVLNSKARPKIYTRSYRTEKEDYDPAKLGWKITVLEKSPDPKLAGFERRKIYDTTQPGRGNGGHTFGDDFSKDERAAVIEYLKTL